jgi:hypothetical protein
VSCSGRFGSASSRASQSSTSRRCSARLGELGHRQCGPPFADDLPAADALERQVAVERVDRRLEAQVGDHHRAERLCACCSRWVDALQFRSSAAACALRRATAAGEVGQARVAAASPT